MTILMCARKLMDASLIYCMEPKTKQKMERTKNKNGYAQKYWCWTRNNGFSPDEGKGSLRWKGFVKQEGFKPGVK